MAGTGDDILSSAVELVRGLYRAYDRNEMHGGDAFRGISALAAQAIGDIDAMHEEDGLLSPMPSGTEELGWVLSDIADAAEATAGTWDDMIAVLGKVADGTRRDESLEKELAEASGKTAYAITILDTVISQAEEYVALG